MKIVAYFGLHSGCKSSPSFCYQINIVFQDKHNPNALLMYLDTILNIDVSKDISCMPVIDVAVLMSI